MQRLKALRARAKTLRILGYVSLAAGLIVFTFVYYTKFHGDMMVLLSQPINVALILFPFIPALVFSNLAVKADKDIIKALSEIEPGEQKKKPS